MYLFICTNIAPLVAGDNFVKKVPLNVELNVATLYLLTKLGAEENLPLIGEGVKSCMVFKPDSTTSCGLAPKPLRCLAELSL